MANSCVSLRASCDRANLRCLVRPEWNALVEIPYSNALDHGKLAFGDVATVTDKEVRLQSGQTLPFDLLVIGELCAGVFSSVTHADVLACTSASGSAMKAPARAPGNTMSASQEWYRRSRAQIESADHITVIGGGAVGLELAAEIRAGTVYSLA